MALSAHAATAIVTNVVNGPGDTIYQNPDASLSTGGIVTIGYFNAGFDVAANASVTNAGILIDNFTIITSALTGSNSPSLGGAFAGFVEQENTTSMGTITDGNPLLGRTLYSFIGNDATLGGSNAYALVQLDVIGNDVPFEFSYNSNPEGRTILIGSQGEFEGNASGFGVAVHPTVQLQLIPEPSVALLGALGGLALLRRRR